MKSARVICKALGLAVPRDLYGVLTESDQAELEQLLLVELRDGTLRIDAIPGAGLEIVSRVKLSLLLVQADQERGRRLANEAFRDEVARHRKQVTPRNV